MQLLCLAACLFGMLVATPSAFGDAATDQYIPKVGPEGSSGADPGDASAGGLGAVAGHPNAAVSLERTPDPERSANVAELPLLDYPSTPFINTLAAVLGGCLLALLAAALIRHRRQVARR